MRGTRELAFDAMAAQSRTYAAAINRLLEEREAPGGGTEVFTTVAIVNAALSIEIGLKALVVKSSDIRNTQELMRCVDRFARHDLNAWFSATHPDAQRFIRDRLMSTKSITRNYLVIATGEVIDALDLQDAMKTSTLEHHLGVFSNCFEEWRYCYEHEFLWICTTVLYELMHSVQEALVYFDSK